MKNKKASFQDLSQGMLGFSVFVVIVIMIIIMLSVTQKSSMVCENGIANQTNTYYNGICYTCFYNGTQPTHLNTSDLTACYNDTQNVKMGSSTLIEYTGSAYNATRYLREASLLPPQFSSLIVIVIIMVSVIGLLAAAGYAIYRKTQD